MQFNINQFEEKLAAIPDNPGCYIFKDVRNKVIYIGKAKDLKKRVMQYFSKSVSHSPRIEQMITRIHDIEYHIVDTELEALVFESNLIKKYRPKYNILMKDDKSYSWIKIAIKEEYPRIIRVREQDKREDGSIFFGPYPDSRSVRNILKFVRKIFPFRTCDYDIKEDEIYEKSRLCLYYHIGLCSGPCDHLIEKLQYRKKIREIIKFLRGDYKDIVTDFKEQMANYSDNMEFERAAVVRDKINDILYITQKININTHVDEEIFKLQRKSVIEDGLAELFEKTYSKNNNNYRMECYDISNIQGTNPVGAMVVFEKGIAKKSDYRKFKIKRFNTPNDFAMMREMLERRLKYIGRIDIKDKSFTSSPDLIIIDGGKGQLSIACEVLKKFSIKIPIIGLAKREELIFFPENSVPLKLKKDSNALYLIQRIRDEAHRFGITFHRKLRSDNSLKSSLDDIKGIGIKTKQKLLKKYRSFENIKNASEEELLTIVSKNIVNKLKLNERKMDL